MGDAYDKGVPHAEGSMAVGHAGVGPPFGESLQLFELFGNESPEASIDFDDMLEA